MSFDRRSLLLGLPAGLLGLADLDELAWAQSNGASSAVAHGVAEFWAKRMGVPPKLLLGGAAGSSNAKLNPGRGADSLSSSSFPSRSSGDVSQLGSSQPIIEATATSAGVVGFGREPLFFQLDEDEHVLVPAIEVPKQKLHPSGDTTVELQMNRLRLNSDDTSQFGRFASGGIYLDMQQQAHQQQSQGANPAVISLASSILSAIFPVSAATAAKGPAKSSAQSSSQPAGASASAASIPLQQTADSQSVSLPGGVGKLGFSCFMKDRRKSAFGTFASAFLEMGSSPSKLSYLPMLSLPVVAAPSLAAIRALVANLQLHGADHQWILGCGNVDVASTSEGCSNYPNSLRFRTGTYIAVPQEHSDLIKNKLKGLKLQNGFLVPKDTGYADVYDAAPQTLPGVTYLSMAVRVKPVKLTGCAVPAPA